MFLIKILKGKLKKYYKFKIFTLNNLKFKLYIKLYNKYNL